MKIAFLGDSLTQANNWQSVFKQHEIQNFGVKGDKTSDVLLRINKVVEFEPQIVFILLGINDLGEAIACHEILNNYKKIVFILQEKNRAIQIFIQSLLPVNKNIFKNSKLQVIDILRFNEFLNLFAKESNCVYLSLYELFVDDDNHLKIDYTSDGLHLNTSAYKLWETILKFKIQLI